MVCNAGSVGSTNHHPPAPDERLAVVRVRLPPEEDVRRIGKLARVARRFDGVNPCDQLLGKVAASGQRPAADAIEDLTPRSQTGMEPTGGVLLLKTFSVTAQHV